MDLDLIWHYVDSLPGQNVPRYSSFNIRLAWRPYESVELFVTGTNLPDADHFEFGNDPFAGTQATRVVRSVFGGVAVCY